MNKKIKERNNKFYTEHGLNALKTRFKSLIDLYNTRPIPFKLVMLGFGILDISSKDELLSRIRELADLTGESFTIKKEITKMTDGTVKETNIMTNVDNSSNSNLVKEVNNGC